MVTIDVSIEDISNLMGFDEPLDPSDLDHYVSYAISEVDSEPEGPDEKGHTKVAIDIKTSNRPDLWSAEGIARIVRGQLGKVGIPPLEHKPSGYTIKVDPDLKEIRPYIGAAVVRGLDLDDFLIKQMIQIQDKVDFSFGRKRKKTSIGIYNINMLSKTIEYKLVERNFKFRPLQFDQELTVDEIFDEHPKGIEYRHILDKFEKVPMLLDDKGMVLSMPPIINSNDVGRVTTETTDVLIETTGTDFDSVNVALSVIVQALRDRGGTVESVEINYPENFDENQVISPQDELVEIEIDPNHINSYLGTDFTSEEMIEFLRKRRDDGELVNNSKIKVTAPPWRKDIIHWVDIAEEIAIAAGYNSLEPTQANVVTAGKLEQSSNDENMVRQLLAGLQLIEVMNYTLTSPKTLTELVNRDQDWLNNKCVVVSNPITATFSVIRSDLIPVLIAFESKNTHIDYPHRIFEVGEIVQKVNNKILTKTHASVLLSGPNETFETCLRLLDSFMRLLGLDYELEINNSKMFISGRRANILIGNENVGHIGEIHPSVITENGIEVPMVAFEIDLAELPNLQFTKYEPNRND